jgi:hypothetical protein
MAFDVKKHLIKVQGGRDYLPVAYRLVWFREDHPDWGIQTDPVSIDLERGVAVFSAVIRNAEGREMAQGTKMETARGFADYVEKAETGAIGRALGVLGYGTQFAPEFDEGERLADSPLPVGANGLRPAPAATCLECGRPMTRSQADLSGARFGRPLCPAHQPRPANGARA